MDFEYSALRRKKINTGSRKVGNPLHLGCRERWFEPTRKSEVSPHLLYGTRSVKPGKWGLYMVIVAELVKRLIVVQEIVGSTPTFHT